MGGEWLRIVGRSGWLAVGSLLEWRDWVSPGAELRPESVSSLLGAFGGENYNIFSNHI